MTLTKTYRFKLYETRQSRGDDHVMMEGTFYHMSDSVELPPSEIRDRWNLLRLAWPTTYAALYCPEIATMKTERGVIGELTHAERLSLATYALEIAQDLLNGLGVPEKVASNLGARYRSEVCQGLAIHDEALDRMRSYIQNRISLET